MTARAVLRSCCSRPEKTRKANAQLVVAAAIAAVLLVPTSSRAQQCLHGPAESQNQRARRDAAVRFLAQVRAAQALSQRERGTYAPLDSARNLRNLPVGFVPRLVFDRWSYIISVEDVLDPCGFTLFSDEHGLIYEAHPTVRSNPASSTPQTDESAEHADVK